MSITVISNQPPDAAVALSDVAKKVVDEPKSAPSPTEDESETEESDPSGNADDADEGDAESDDEPESKDEKPRKRNGFKRRIDKLTTRLTDREREIEYWKAQALKSQSPKQDVETERRTESKADVQGRPNPDHFDSHDDFVEALTDWKLEQRERERETKQRETQLKTEHQQQVDSHTARLKTFAKNHKDFEDVLSDVDDIPMSVTVQQVILSSDNGPELMYELAKNPDEYARICKLPAIAAARELGKFEARLSREADEKPETKEIKTTKAPKPLSPVGSKSGAVTKSIFDPNLSQGDYERLRMEQMKRR